MKKIFTLTLFLIFLSGCSSKKTLDHNWTGFYYPDKDNINDESAWIIQPGFESLEKCQEWILFDISKNNKNFDYECGYKCKYDNLYKTTICEKTLK